MLTDRLRGQKSREKENAADFSVDRMGWAFSQTAHDAVQRDIDRREVMQEQSNNNSVIKEIFIRTKISYQKP